MRLETSDLLLRGYLDYAKAQEENALCDFLPDDDDGIRSAARARDPGWEPKPKGGLFAAYKLELVLDGNMASACSSSKSRVVSVYGTSPSGT